MVDWNMAVYDPMKSFNSGSDYVNRLYDTQAMRQAGSAAASGDYQRAAEAIGSRGDVEGALRLRTFGDTQKNAEIDRKLKMFQAQTDYMKRAVPIFTHIFKTAGPQAALQAFDQITPELQQIGVSQETIAQYRDAFQKNPEQMLQILGASVQKEYEFRSSGNDVLVFEKGNPNPVNTIKGEPASPEAPKAPTTRTVNIGGEEVTQEYGPDGWKEVGRAPRYKPEAAGGGVNPRQQQQMTVQLRKEFNQLPDVKAFNDVAASFEIINDIAMRANAAEKAGGMSSAADDMSMIFAYMKMLDPGSVVREGEFANAQNTAGVPDQIRNMYNRALNGNRLNSKQRSDFAATARGVYQSRKKRYDQLVREYRGYARDSGLPEDTISARIDAGGGDMAPPSGGRSRWPMRPRTQVAAKSSTSTISHRVRTMDVRLEDGTIVKNVPEGTTKAELMRRLGRAGPSSAVDAARAVPGGLVKGVAGIIGLPGDVQQWITGGQRSTSLPNSQQVGEFLAAPAGGFYEPQTTAGKYAETIASFAPAAAFPGSAVARGARVAVPGAASEAAGQLTEGTPLEPYARVGGALLGAGGVAAAPRIARGTIRSINRATESATGQGFLNPEQEAVRRLREAAQRDNPNVIRQEMQDYAASGASDPSLLDVSGNNVMRVMRSAASGGEGGAQNIATTYADRIAGNLQDRAVGHARRLTPNEPRPANIVADELETTRGNLAQQQYRQPYSEPAAVTREMVSALQGPEGRSAINRAYAAARANRDTQQMAELQDLRTVANAQSGGRDALTGRMQSLDDALANLSAGSLDRVRIAMRETGNALAESGARDTARGYRGRVRDIDTALDQTPGLQEARGTYRDLSTQREAVDVGRTGLNAPGDEYAAQIADLARVSPRATQAAGVGYRQSITDAIQRPAEGSTGTLNRLATSNQQTQNLATTFGPDAANRFQVAISREARRLSKARQISPNTGSQTALRTQDEALVNVVMGQGGYLRAFADWIRGATSTLTNAEREAVVRLGTSEVDLQRLLQDLPPPRRAQLARQFAASAQLSGGNSRQ